MSLLLLGVGGGRGFDPLTLSPALWLDASDLTTLFQDDAGTVPVTADNDPVGLWRDKSGNNRHWSTATSGFRPIYKVNVQNGKPGVLFDGVDNALNFATGLAAASMVNSTGFFTGKPTGGGGNDFVLSMTTAMSGGAYALRFNSLTPELVNANLAVKGSATNPVSNTTGSLTMAKWDGDDWSFRTNRVANGSGTNAQALTAATTTLGAQDGDSGQYFAGIMNELFYVYSQLSVGNVVLYEDARSAYWGTP